MGAAAAAAAVVIPRVRSSAQLVKGKDLVATHADMLRAIATALLGPALPEAAAGRDSELQRVLAATGELLDNLPSSTRAEVAELFGLLEIKAARALLGYSGDWTAEDKPGVTAFMASLRDSSIGLKQQAYFAFHDLLLGCFYSDARTWAATGYAGPPRLT